MVREIEPFYPKGTVIKKVLNNARWRWLEAADYAKVNGEYQYTPEAKDKIMKIINARPHKKRRATSATPTTPVVTPYVRWLLARKAEVESKIEAIQKQLAAIRVVASIDGTAATPTTPETTTPRLRRRRRIIEGGIEPAKAVLDYITTKNDTTIITIGCITETLSKIKKERRLLSRTSNMQTLAKAVTKYLVTSGKIIAEKVGDETFYYPPPPTK